MSSLVSFLSIDTLVAKDYIFKRPPTLGKILGHTRIYQSLRWKIALSLFHGQICCSTINPTCPNLKELTPTMATEGSPESSKEYPPEEVNTLEE